MVSAPQDIISAHRHSSRHRDEIAASVTCGCFYCLRIFPPAEIEDWVDWPEDAPDELQLKLGTTALCPKCGIDSVIGSASGCPIETAFLERMNRHWF
jgi:hypothetical protein